MLEMTGARSIETTWQRFGSLINSGLILLGALGLIFKLGGDVVQMRVDIAKNGDEIIRLERAQNERWQGHEAYHRDRLAETKQVQGELAQRMKAIEDKQAEAAQLTFRVGSIETQVQTMNTTFGEVRRDLATVVTAVEVIRQWIDQDRRDKRRMSGPPG